MENTITEIRDTALSELQKLKGMGNVMKTVDPELTITKEDLYNWGTIIEDYCQKIADSLTVIGEDGTNGE